MELPTKGRDFCNCPIPFFLAKFRLFYNVSDVISQNLTAWRMT